MAKTSKPIFSITYGIFDKILHCLKVIAVWIYWIGETISHMEIYYKPISHSHSHGHCQGHGHWSLSMSLLNICGLFFNIFKNKLRKWTKYITRSKTTIWQTMLTFFSANLNWNSSLLTGIGVELIETGANWTCLVLAARFSQTFPEPPTGLSRPKTMRNVIIRLVSQ